MDGVAEEGDARRLKLDVKTVRLVMGRLGRSTQAVGVSPRPSALDAWRERIKQWLCEGSRVGPGGFSGCGRRWRHRSRCAGCAGTWGRCGQPPPSSTSPRRLRMAMWWTQSGAAGRLDLQVQMGRLRLWRPCLLGWRRDHLPKQPRLPSPCWHRAGEEEFRSRSTLGVAHDLT